MKQSFKMKLAEFLLKIVGPLYVWARRTNAGAERKRQEALIIADGLRRLKAYHERLNSGNLHPDSLSLGTHVLPQHCDHLKGGRYRLHARDSSLVMHTFIDTHVEVKCMKCRTVWKEGDPDFKKMVDLAVNHSTNKPSSSEVPLYALDKLGRVFGTPPKKVE